MPDRIRIRGRHASFTKAAAELHLTQSAISRQIAQLEDFLGRSLFVREHRALRLTIAGERYAKHVQLLLANCSEATLDVMKRYGDQELTIACSSGVAVLWLTPRLGEFRAAHPNVRIRMIVRDGLASLSPAEFDVGMYYIRQRAEAYFTARRIFDENVFPVCSPSHLGRPRIVPADLVHETLLIQEDGQRQWMSWSDWFRMNDVQMPGSLQSVAVNHYPELVEMAILGQGVVLGWHYMIDACLERRTTGACDACICKSRRRLLRDIAERPLAEPGSASLHTMAIRSRQKNRGAYRHPRIRGFSHALHACMHANLSFRK